MALNWRETLGTLLAQFEARAARSTGLNHLFVEVADHERNKMNGPEWFSRVANDVKVVDGQLKFEKWGVSKFCGLPSVGPSFREAKATETFAESDLRNVIRDISGVVRAVAVPMKLRQGYYCGLPTEEVSGFESLANAAATALTGSSNLSEHPFASDLTDIFRTPRGGVRYIFGEVPDAPKEFLSQGWGAGVLQFENGVLIDVPIAESAPDSSHWLLLLHRLGWRRIAGTGLRAERKAWKGNVSVALEMLNQDWSHYPEGISTKFADISKESFYSVLGTREAPLDLNVASVFAVQLLLGHLPAEEHSAQSQSKDRLHVEDVDSFAKVRDVNRSAVAGFLNEGYLDKSEDVIQTALESILGVPFHKKDWGGEGNDLYTANVVVNGARRPSAFMLKGNGLKNRTMEVKHCGKNGDQVIRLFQSPADLFVIQFVGNISESVIHHALGEIARLKTQNKETNLLIIDGQDTARLMHAYGML